MKRELDDAFDELIARGDLGFGRLGRFERWQWRRQLFADIAPVWEATTQFVEIELPIDWRKIRQSGIGAARIAVVSSTTRSSDVGSVLPLLISGRPIAATSESHAGALPLPAMSSLLTLNEAELALLALEQLRHLFGFRTGTVSRVPHLSVVLATNRPALLAAAVEQIKAQRFVTVDLLVGVHGGSDPMPAPSEFVDGAVVTCGVRPYDAEVLFGDMLADLTTRVSTGFVVKWDDDDLYGPHHLFDMWLFALLARAPMVGKAAEFVLLEAEGLLVRRRGGAPYRPTRWLAGGALLMSTRAMLAVGNWGALRRGVDHDIIGRFDDSMLKTFRLHGYEFVLVRHEHGHTWAADGTYFTDAAELGWSGTALDRAGLGEDASDALRTFSGPPGQPQVTICVPNQDNQFAVDRFVRAIETYDPKPRLIVCDDRSEPHLTMPDDSDRIQIVRMPDGNGFGAGRSRHHGALAAETDVLVFADADMYITPDAFADTYRAFADGFLGAIHAEIDFGDVDSRRAASVLQTGGFDDVAGLLAERRLEGQTWRERHWAASADLTHPRSSSFRGAVGAYLAIDRESYARTGGFRDVVVRGVEDTEFGYRLMAAGCEQRVLRTSGVWHLGDRTFAGDMSPVIAQEREAYLNAFVPIWARTLGERAAALQGWEDPIVPAVEVPSGLDDELNIRLGRGTAIAERRPSSLLQAPFCVATELDQGVHMVGAVDAALRAFRNGAAGEVAVVWGEQTVGRFVATWAVNLARQRLGLPWMLPGRSDDWLNEVVLQRLRTDSGIAFVGVSP